MNWIYQAQLAVMIVVPLCSFLGWIARSHFHTIQQQIEKNHQELEEFKTELHQLNQERLRDREEFAKNYVNFTLFAHELQKVQKSLDGISMDLKEIYQNRPCTLAARKRKHD